jgi:hypothetical protein
MDVLYSELEVAGGCVQRWVGVLLKPVPDIGNNSRLKVGQLRAATNLTTPAQ